MQRLGVGRTNEVHIIFVGQQKHTERGGMIYCGILSFQFSIVLR
jgi:hypothetical protein